MSPADVMERGILTAALLGIRERRIELGFDVGTQVTDTLDKLITSGGVAFERLEICNRDFAREAIRVFKDEGATN